MNNLVTYLIAGVKVLYAPEKTFRELDENGLKSPWPMLVTLMLLSTLISVVAAPVYMQAFQAQAAQMQNIPTPEPKFFYIRALLSGLIFFPLILLIEALVYHIFAPLADADSSYSDVFQVVVYSSVVTVIAQLLSVIIMAATGSSTVMFSPAVFLPRERVMATFFGRFLSQLSIFSIWSVYIIGVGIAVKGRTRKSKALIMAYSVWLVWKIFVAALGGFAPQPRPQAG